MFKPGDKVRCTTQIRGSSTPRPNLGSTYTVTGNDYGWLSLAEVPHGANWGSDCFELVDGPHLIGLQGYARSGKDSVAAVLGGYGYTRVAFADPLRDALYALNPIADVDTMCGGWETVQQLVDEYGWEKAKESPEVRRLLKVLGTEVVRDIVGENVWVDIAVRKIEAIVGAVVVTDVRFPNEVEAIRQRGGQIWQIERRDHGPLDGHSSEALPCPDPEARIFNHSTLESLDSQVELVLRCAK